MLDWSKSNNGGGESHEPSRQGRDRGHSARHSHRARGGQGRHRDCRGRGATRLRSGAKTRKSAATREKIMTAATELMVERGNTDFQMSEVSARCQMSKGALYYYFADKGALVQAIFDASIDDLVNQIEGARGQGELGHGVHRGHRPRARARHEAQKPAGPCHGPGGLQHREVRPALCGDAPGAHRLHLLGAVRPRQGGGARAPGGEQPPGGHRHRRRLHLRRPGAAEENGLFDSDEFSAQLVRLAFEGMGTPKAQERLGLDRAS